ncbi:MAG: hypothetical protein DRJ69_01405, partial [Thermoprotei archaeon]
LEDRRVEELSGGQLQRLVVACALAMDSRALVLDEPLAYLDPRGARELMELLVKLKGAGKAVVLIEHRLRDLVGFYEDIDEVLLLDEGRVVGRLAGRRLHEGVDKLIGLGLRVPANFEASSRLKAELSSPVDVEPLALFLKSLPQSVRALEGPRLRDGVVEVRGVWASYGGSSYALRDVSLRMEAGRSYAVMGPNASGKTTLLRVLMGLLKPKRGSVSFLGVKVRSLRNVVGLVGYVPQNPDLTLMSKTVRDELESRARGRSMEEVAKQLRVDDLLDRNPHSLSRGQRFRVALAAALALNPKALLLDEPTTGQDEECIEALGRAIRGFVEEGGLAVVVTHDVDFALNYADHCVVLNSGEVYAEGEVGEVLSRSDVTSRCGLARPMVLDVCCSLGLPPIYGRLGAQLLWGRRGVEAQPWS